MLDYILGVVKRSRKVFLIILMLFILTMVGCKSNYYNLQDQTDISFDVDNGNIKVINGSEEFWVGKNTVKSSEIKDIVETFNIVLVIDNKNEIIDKMKNKEIIEEIKNSNQNEGIFSINSSGILNSKNHMKLISINDTYYELRSDRGNDLLNINDIKKEVMENDFSTDNTFNYIYHQNNKYRITNKKVELNELGTMLGNVKFKGEDLFYAIYSRDNDKLLKKGEYNNFEIIPSEKSNIQYDAIQLGYIYKFPDREIVDGFVVEKDNELFLVTP